MITKKNLFAIVAFLSMVINLSSTQLCECDTKDPKACADWAFAGNNKNLVGLRERLSVIKNAGIKWSISGINFDGWQQVFTKENMIGDVECRGCSVVVDFRDGEKISPDGKLRQPLGHGVVWKLGVQKGCTCLSDTDCFITYYNKDTKQTRDLRSDGYDIKWEFSSDDPTKYGTVHISLKK